MCIPVRVHAPAYSLTRSQPAAMWLECITWLSIDLFFVSWTLCGICINNTNKQLVANDTINLQTKLWRTRVSESDTCLLKSNTREATHETTATVVVPLQLWQRPLTTARNLWNSCQISPNSIALQQIIWRCPDWIGFKSTRTDSYPGRGQLLWALT